MQNIPIFTAANGLASLVLREIPYSGRAYVLLRSVWNGAVTALAEECAAFCRMAGAKAVYVSWDCETLPLPHAYDMVELHCSREDLPSQTEPVELVPLTAERADQWRSVYNRCFLPIVGAAAYDRRDVSRLIKEKTGFLVTKDGVCAAIVELKSDGLAAIGVLPEYRGMGTNVVLTALQRVNAPVLTVRTASTNTRALAMYHRLGFRQEKIVSRWWLAETKK